MDTDISARQQVPPGQDAQRIVVVGTSGSGKTTCASQLAQKLAIPHIELDALFWDANWTPALPLEFRARVTQALQNEGWVIDGNYSKVRDLIWQRATMVVWLDYSLWTIMKRLLKRTVIRIVQRKELWNGNRETWMNAVFSQESILLWALKTYRKNRRVYARLISQPEYTHMQFVHLRSPYATDEWLLGLPGETA
jgi:adenylate kinase family enzyme